MAVVLAITLGLVWLCTDPLFAATYYVDPVDGLDTADGTSEATAWKTISKVGSASSGFLPGDTVKFRRGTVIGPDATTGTMTIAADGISGSPITFTDYTKSGEDEGQSLPILDMGNVAISGWVEQSGVDPALAGVYYNSYSGTTFNGLYYDRIQQPHASSITSINDGEMWWNKAENSEYAVNVSYANGIYWRPPSGVVPANVTTRKASNGQGVVITDRSYLTFSNLHFAGGQRCIYGVSTTASIHHIVITGSTFSECQSAVKINAGSGFNTYTIWFIDNTVSDSQRGLYVGALSDTGAQTTTGSIWRGNSITSIGETRWTTYKSVDQEAISSQGSVEGIYENNTVTDSPLADCLSLWANTSGPIDKNIIRSNSCTTVKNGIILGAAVGTTTSGAQVIAGNLILGCTAAGIRANISGTVRSVVSFNTVSQCSTNYYTQTSQGNWVFTNNISLSPLLLHASWGGTSTSRPDRNVYYPSAGQVFAENGVETDFAGFKTALIANGVDAPDTNSSTADPLVLGAIDLRLQAGSPYRRAGYPGYLCIDVRGRACFPDSPDIGAYQSTSGDPAGPRAARQ